MVFLQVGTESLRAGHWHIIWKLFHMSNTDAAGYSSFMRHIGHIIASFHMFPIFSILSFHQTSDVNRTQELVLGKELKELSVSKTPS